MMASALQDSLEVRFRWCSFLTEIFSASDVGNGITRFAGSGQQADRYANIVSTFYALKPIHFSHGGRIAEISYSPNISATIRNYIREALTVRAAFVEQKSVTRQASRLSMPNRASPQFLLVDVKVATVREVPAIARLLHPAPIP